jgi:DNA-binding Lrp family transcriptional regulator
MQSLDQIDFDILRELRKDARLSNKELAARIGLAPSSCLVRVRGLQADGVLTGFHATVEPKAIGVGLQAMISVRLQRHSRSALESFRAHTLALPEVRQLYHVAGANDFLVHVWVSDPEHLRDLAMTSFTARDEVAHIETGLIFEHTSSSELPRFLDFDTNND